MNTITHEIIETESELHPHTFKFFILIDRKKYDFRLINPIVLNFFIVIVFCFLVERENSKPLHDKFIFFEKNFPGAMFYNNSPSHLPKNF